MPNPNVLMLMGDEHPVFMLGCYGHRSVKSPTLDGLAQRGVVFDAAYCPSPICAPSRAAMMTGRHVHTIGVWDNAAPLASDWPTVAHSFRAAGYRTVACGKLHYVGPDQYHGFEERWTQDIYPATFDWTRSNRAEVAVNPGQNIHQVMRAGIGRSNDMDYDDEALFRATYGLQRLARREDRRPWFLCVSFSNPHPPYVCPEAYWNRYSDDDVDLPAIPDDYLDREHDYVKWLRRHGSFDRLVPDDICRAARRSTLGRVSMLDDALGRILALIDELGFADDTVVLYTSDHGDMMGEHGLWFKNAAYEWSSRVPLMVAGPGIEPRREAEIVSLLDLGPTLCGLAGIEPIYDVTDGRDVSDLVMGARPSGDGLAVMENYGEGVWRGWRMVRRGQYKLNVVPDCEPELFDLDADPDEWANLAADPAHAAVRADLERIALDGWDPDAADEDRWRSEERRLAILRAHEQGPPLDWLRPSPSPEHPLGLR